MVDPAARKRVPELLPLREILLISLAILALVGYWVLRNWLANIAFRDMRRRGRPGWLIDTAVFWWTPVGLLAWWIVRRRYPIVCGDEKKRTE